MAMTIHEAMSMIANVQAALIQHGFAVGNYGPCGDGIDGRYGPSTRAGFANYAASIGLPFDKLPSDELLAALEAGPIPAAAFAEAVNVWNQFRAATPSYAAAADQTLCESTGVCGGETCPGAAPPGPVVPPPTGPVSEDEKPSKWPLIVLGIVGAGVAAFIGYHAYKDHQEKKARGRTVSAGAFGSDYTGRKITGVELGEAQKPGEDQEEGFEGQEGEEES